MPRSGIGLNELLDAMARTTEHRSSTARRRILRDLMWSGNLLASDYWGRAGHLESRTGVVTCV